MSDFIDRIREAANIEALAGELTQLEGRGARRLGLCPFHSEKTPSFTVFVEQNRWHCFGCGRHGSAIDLVMESRKEEFWEAALILAQKYGIPVPTLTEEEKKECLKRESVETLLTFYAGACHRKLLKAPEALEYLRGRGVTDESMEAYEIGLGFKPSKDVDKALAKEAGITDTRLVGRITFPVRRGGKVVQISARSLDDGKPKYLFLSRDLYPFNAHRLRGEQVMLAEGVLDAILLEQAGFAACSTGTHFKREWLRLIGRETNCYCCYDPDGAGAEASRKIGELLFDSDHKVYNIRLPEGHDPASLIQSEGAGAMQAVLDAAASYVDSLIVSIPPNLNSYDLPKALEFIYSKLARLPATSHDRYTVKLAEKLSLSKPAIRKELKEFLRESKARKTTDDPPTDDRIAWRKTEPILFNPAQDIVDGILYYSVYLQMESGALSRFLINSNRQLIPHTREALLERGFTSESVPSNQHRWSIGTDIPFNIRDYLEERCHTEPKSIFGDVRWYFTRFLKLPDPLYYDFLALWCMATYHFRLYDAFGYLYLSAIKGSGKTQALQIVEWLAFNAKKADVITEAGLKRLVNSSSCTLINDEAEKLRRKAEKDDSALFEVWNGGYKKSGRAILVNKDSFSVEEYCTYSPKALANTTGLDSVLEDRCVTLYFQKDIGKFPQLIEEEHKQNITVLRNMLYCFSLEHIEGIIEAKKQVERPEQLSGREWELWQPVIVLARYLDNFSVIEDPVVKRTGGTTEVIPTLLGRMQKMAIERRNYKASLEEEANPQARVLNAIWQYIGENPSGNDLYPAKQLRAYVKDELGWEKFGEQMLSSYIFEHLHLCYDRNTDKPRLRIPNGKRMFFYRLKRDVIIERARQMFGVDLTLQAKEAEGTLDWTGPNENERDPFEDE